MRWSDDEFARYMRHGPAGLLTEKAWQTALLRILKQHDYTFCYHTFDARRSPSGFPDVVAVHRAPGHPLLAVELKTDTGQCTAAQEAWLTALAGSRGIVTGTWRPRDLDNIVTLLRSGARL